MHSHSHLHAAGADGPSLRPAIDVDARVPLLAVLLAIAAIGSEPLGEILPYALYLPLVAMFVIQGERGVFALLRRIGPALPVLAMLALGLPLSRAVDGWLNSIAAVPGSDGSSPPFGDGAWPAALSLFLRAFCAVALVSTLVQTVGFAPILRALRGLGLPAAVVLTLQHMERYRTLIAEEWRRTNQARESRSPGGLRFAFASYANQTSLVFLRSWERSERIHAAMLARGFRLDAPGGTRSAVPAKPLGLSLLPYGWLPAFALLIRLAV